MPEENKNSKTTVMNDNKKILDEKTFNLFVSTLLIGSSRASFYGHQIIAHSDRIGIMSFI